MITYNDLRNLTGVINPPMLLCSMCGREMSAHRGDYFTLLSREDRDDVIKCCGYPVRYVRKQVMYTDCDINEDLSHHREGKSKPTEVK